MSSMQQGAPQSRIAEGIMRQDLGQPLSHASSVPEGSSSWPTVTGASCLLRMALRMCLLVKDFGPLPLLLDAPMSEWNER